MHATAVTTTAFSSVIIGWALLSQLLPGQQSTTSAFNLNVNDSRPLAAAALEIERMSGIPVNYEDVPYRFPGDTADVTTQIMTPAQRAQATPGVSVIVPRGWAISVPIPLDAATRLLPDSASVSAALNSVLSEYNAAPTAAGQFRVESDPGTFYLEPTSGHTATGASVSVVPLLSTPVNIPTEQRKGFETLQIILDQVSRAAGAQRIKIGSIPAFTFNSRTLTFSAAMEPANRVLSRLFKGLLELGAGAPGGSQAMSYRLLYEPKEQDYVMNVHIVPNPNVKPPATNSQPSSKSDPGRFHQRAQ